jgi:hypothetical protein
MNCPVGVLGKARVVRHHANRGAAGVQLFQQIHDGFAISGIEISRRLVGQKDGRPAGQGTGHRHALLLMAEIIMIRRFRFCAATCGRGTSMEERLGVKPLGRTIV